MFENKKISKLLLCTVGAGLLSIGFLPNILRENVGDSSSTASSKTNVFKAPLSNYIEWSYSNSLPDSAGNYYLANDVNITNSWSTRSDINLDLNGHNIVMNGGNCITVCSGSTLTISDSSEGVIHKFSDNEGLWVLDDTLTGEDIKHTVNGGCMMGLNPVAGQVDGIGVFINSGCTLVLNGGNIVGSYAANYGGGVNICEDATFIMNGGSVCGNKSGLNAGGVCNSGTFVMNGGSIQGNTTSGNGGGVWNNAGTFTMTGGVISNNTSSSGGGVYCGLASVSILTGGEIKNNVANYGGGLFYQAEACFAPGTPITMADGSKKAIEDIESGEYVRVFNHENGEIATSKIYEIWSYPEKHSGLVNLHFSHDIDLTVVYAHSFFERETSKYVSVTRDNVNNYVGHEFYNVDDQRWETLEGYDLIDGEANTYVIASEKYLNCVANGMLSNEDGFYTLLTNIFEYDGLVIDANKKAKDIEKYGLYDFDNLKYASYETYDVLNLKYLNVAFNKGLISEKEFEKLEAYWVGEFPDFYGNGENKEPAKRLLKGPLFANPEPVPAPTASGVYVGGSIKIVNNYNDNVYLGKSKFLTIGTGVSEGGNGVLLPNADMNIGVTLEGSVGSITYNYVEGSTSKFFADNDRYSVLVNEGTDTEGDECLEIKVLVNFDEDYVWNDGNSILYGDEYEDTTPKVYEDETELTELTISCAYYQKVNNSWNKLADKPVNAGEYKAVFTVSDDTYAGSKEYLFNIGKIEQSITIDDISKIYDATSVFFNKYSTSYSYLGDTSANDVIVEFKGKDEDDTAYAINAPKNPGNYVVRVTVPEGTNYLQGTATKDFIIDYAKIYKVAFDDITQPVATETAPTEVTGIAIASRYTGSVSWYPALVDGKFDYGTTYTATISLDIVPSSRDNYRFVDNVTLVNPKINWTKSADSTGTQLIYTRTFEATEKGAQSISITSDISKTYDGSAVFAPTYTKLGDGEVAIEYKLASENDTAYTTVAPKNAGNYVVRVSVAESDSYLSGSKTAEFTISKASLTDGTKNKTISYDGNDHGNLEEIESYINISGTGENPIAKKFSLDNVNFKLDSEFNWSQFAAKEVGEHKIYYQYEYSNHSYVAGSFTLTITSNDEEVVITNDISKVYDGSAVSAPTYTKLGDGEVTIEYKLASENDAAYTTVAPKNAGNYVVRVSVAKSDGYLSGFATKEFTISKASLSDDTENITISYDGNDHANLDEIESYIKINGTTENPVTKKYSLDNTNFELDSTFDWSKVNAKEAGEYTIYFEYEFANYDVIRGSFKIFIEREQCIVHWISIPLCIVGIALFVIFSLLKKNKLISLICMGIELLTSVILMILGNCAVCTVFGIINIVLFVFAIVYILLFQPSKEEEH